MRELAFLEKQQVALQIPKYLLDEVDEFPNIFYKEFDEACIELKDAIKNKREENSLEDLINELENN